MKKSIVFSCICAVIVFIAAYAVICPNMQIKLEDGAITTLKIEFWRYVLTASVTLFTFAFCFTADKFFNIFQKFCNLIKRKAKRTVLFATGVLGSLVAAALIEILFRAICGTDSIGSYFNAASFGAFAVVILCMFIFIFEKDKIATKPETAVTLIILIAGLLIIFTEPFSHNSSDEDSHYYYAVQNSFLDEAHLSNADYAVRHTIDFSITNSHSLVPSNEKVELMNARDEVSTYTVEVYNSLPHRLAGVFIAVARLFGADFRTKFVCGQFAMLIIYATTVYFAIRKLKSGKMIMSVIALFPTTIVLASNYSYDAWVVGFSLLGISYFVSELEQPEKPITVTETIVMCGALFLAALPKQVYVVLMILPMFMRKNWSDKQQKRRYYLILLVFFAFMMILFALRSFSSISGGGDSRGGNVDSMGQLNYILTNPFKYADILIKFLCEYLSPLNADKYITFFSYLGDGGSAAIFVVALIFGAITDKNRDYNRFKGYNFIRIIVLLINFMLVCLIATALYISFTPVASETINGCNPRYLIPLVAPIALTVANPGVCLTRNKLLYNMAILVPVTLCLIYKILRVITLPML